jgi:hypothetical protein
MSRTDRRTFNACAGSAAERGVQTVIDSKREAIASHPRWDGRRVLFEIADGDRSAACTISANALQDLSGQRRLKPAADLLACFDEVRARIGAIALAKLRSRTAGATGLLYVWSDDIDDPPPASAPAAAALRVDASREPEPDRVRAA